MPSDGNRLVKLALLAQFAAISIIIPAPILLLIGPFTFYMLALVFIGKRGTGLLVVLDFLIDAPQYIVQTSSSSAVAPAAIATPAIVHAVSTYSPFSSWMASNPIIGLGLILSFVLGCCYLEFKLLKFIFWNCYQQAKMIRSRVPRRLWS